LDVAGDFNEDFADLPALRAGLVRDESLAEKLPGRVRGFGGAGNGLDAASFAASAGMDLGFDNQFARRQLSRNRFRFFGRKRHAAIGHRHAEAAEEFFGLVFVNVHACAGGGI
jgi:hypothetical protein